MSFHIQKLVSIKYTHKLTYYNNLFQLSSNYIIALGILNGITILPFISNHTSFCPYYI